MNSNTINQDDVNLIKYGIDNGQNKESDIYITYINDERIRRNI